MKYSWRSTETGPITYHETSSNQSPLTIRNTCHDAIPPGTVSSRIQFLQNLANPIASRSHPPPIRIRRGADSRTGFGRRMTNRFGKPALHNTNPDEEPQVEPSLHSFLGLSTPRINHKEQHAIADHRNRYARSPGINGQIIPDGLVTRRQHDAVAPWAVLSRSNRTRSMGRQVTDPEVDAVKETASSRKQEPHTTESLRFRSDSEDDAKYVDLYHLQVKSRPADTMHSEASSSTTSATRRQSVRDLFKDYGIERPPGLASRETSYDATNNPKSLISKENWSIDQRTATQRLLKPLPTSVLAQKKLPLSVQKTSQPPTSFSYLHRVKTSKSQKKASQTPKHDRPFPEGPALGPVRQESQMPAKVRDSPFIIADLLALNRSLPSCPVRAPVSNGHSDGGAQSRQKQLDHPHGTSSSSNGYICGSPTCRATHHGHQPYRHAVACIKKKRHRQVHRDTDNGYSADTSRVEDVVLANVSPFTDDARQYYHGCSSTLPDSHHGQVSRPCAGKAKSSGKQDIQEYVECHGYPRTGHSRLGSPVSSGVVGECQHCLHDCHCLACQRTSHSVRCCVHADHQAMVHHHLTPRKEMSASEKGTLPLPGPTTSNKQSASSHVATIIPSSGQKSLAETAESPRSSSRPAQPGKRPNLVKMPRPLRSKTTTLIAGVVAKPPTPPPWVSSPRRETKSAIATVEHRKETRQDDADTALGAERLVDPPPSFKQRPTFPPAAPCDASSPEGSRRRSNDLWATLRCRQEPDFDDSLQASDKRPSRNSIVEKHSRDPSLRSPSRMQISHPGSGRASRRLSALFQLREKNTVPLLNQKLQEHQEELRRTQKECDEQMGAVAKSLLNHFKRKNEREELNRNVMSEETERVQSADNSKAHTMRKMNWRLRLVDRKPRPACGNDQSMREHRLDDDKMDSGSKISDDALPEKRNELAIPSFEDHDCVWKNKLLEQNIQGLGIRGVTVLLHLEGKEDVIFKVVDWQGREQREKT